MHLKKILVSLPVLIMSLFIQSCRLEQRMEFHIRSGEACETLKLFAMQAQVDILFSESDLHGIQTHEVNGKMVATSALRKMISETGLIFHHDKESQAIAVYYRTPE